MPKPTLRQFNNFLNVVLIVLALYIFLMPFWPKFALWLHQQVDETDGYIYQNNLRATADAQPIPSDNRLVIPGIMVNEPIKEGQNLSVINKGGTWHRPQTSNPAEGGNTVIVGHRFTYQGSSVFYHLDQLKAGDHIIIYWQGKEYDYRVASTEVVAPNTSEIEQSSGKPILTLYTCTPLWTAENRLVITAEPIGDHNE